QTNLPPSAKQTSESRFRLYPYPVRPKPLDRFPDPVLERGLGIVPEDSPRLLNAHFLLDDPVPGTAWVIDHPSLVPRQSVHQLGELVDRPFLATGQVERFPVDSLGDPCAGNAIA